MMEVMRGKVMRFIMRNIIRNVILTMWTNVVQFITNFTYYDPNYPFGLLFREFLGTQFIYK